MKRALVGSRIRSLRVERGLTQAALAELLEISPAYLNQIEHDKRPLTVPVLLRITATFGIDPEFFSTQDTARLTAELREALLDEALGVVVVDAEVAELAEGMPSVARALIALRRRYRDTVERASAQLGGTVAAEEAALGTMPHEEVRDFFYDRKNYVGPLDEAAEDLHAELEPAAADLRVPLIRHLRARHGVRVLNQPADAPPGELRRFDRDAKALWLSSQLRPGQQAFQLASQVALLEHSDLLDELIADSGLSGPETVALTRIGLANYYAAALLMPYRAFRAAAEEQSYDVERLADRFGVGFEVVCHRLSTLQRPGLTGVPFSFVRVDRAGNMSKRQSATGFHFSRGGGTCPLWAVYEAFTTPGQILTQIARMPDGRDYFWIARTVARKRTGYGMPTKTFALGLGCELRHARRLVYSAGLDLSDRSLATRIGMGCKTCEWADCPQRAFPSLSRALALDERRSTFEPYPMGDGPSATFGPDSVRRPA